MRLGISLKGSGDLESEVLRSLIGPLNYDPAGQILDLPPSRTYPEPFGPSATTLTLFVVAFHAQRRGSGTGLLSARNSPSPWVDI